MRSREHHFNVRQAGLVERKPCRFDEKARNSVGSKIRPFGAIVRICYIKQKINSQSGSWPHPLGPAIFENRDCHVPDLGDVSGFSHFNDLQQTLSTQGAHVYYEPRTGQYLHESLHRCHPSELSQERKKPHSSPEGFSQIINGG